MSDELKNIIKHVLSESVEPIEELNYITLQRYHSKAKQDNKENIRLRNDIDSYAAMYRFMSGNKDWQQPKQEKLNKKIKERSKGIKMAYKKMKDKEKKNPNSYFSESEILDSLKNLLYSLDEEQVDAIRAVMDELIMENLE